MSGSWRVGTSEFRYSGSVGVLRRLVGGLDEKLFPDHISWWTVSP